MNDLDTRRGVEEFFQGIGRPERHAARQFDLSAIPQKSQLMCRNIVSAAREEGTLGEHRPDDGGEIDEGAHSAEQDSEPRERSPCAPSGRTNVITGSSPDAD